MRETIKKAFIFGIVFSITTITIGFVYASVKSGDTLTAEMWNNMTNSIEDKYLTDGTEVLTNKTYDGKPVYRKFYSRPVSEVKGGAWKRLITFDNGIENVINGVFGFGNVGNNIVLDGNTGSTDWGTSAREAHVLIDGLYGYIGTNYSGTLWVFVEYTKISD